MDQFLVYQLGPKQSSLQSRRVGSRGLQTKKDSISQAKSGIPALFGMFLSISIHPLIDLTSFYRLSANMAVATLNVGTIGGAIGLSFWDSFAIIVIVNLVSCLIPAWTAGFGLSGLRMTTFS